MTPQAVGVFWLGLILIFLNFWLSGQSTTFWNDVAHHITPNAGTGGSNPGGGSGIVGGSGGNPPGSNPGPMILPIP